MNVAIFIHQPACSVDSANGIIKSLAPQHSFKLFSKDEVEPTFFDDVDMVCIPGGIGDADRFEILMRHNAAHIRKYVRRGGKYLGICMGAYWAGKYYFDILKDVQVNQYIRRPGTDTKRPHAKAQRVLWKGQEYKMYFYDGCTFVGQGVLDSQIWSLYPNGDPMAIIQNNIGLIGCHPESQQYWYNKKYLEPHWHRGIHHELLCDFVSSF